MAIRRANTSKVIGDTYRNAMASQSFGGGSGPEPDPWVRPADWLALPAASTSFVGLFAVYNDNSNYVALNAAGDYTVDWGDGTAPEDFTAYTTAQHQYVYSSIAPGTESSRGYRQVIVTVTPQSGQSFTMIDVHRTNTALPNLSNYSPYYSVPWLDISIDGSDLTSMTIGSVLSWIRFYLLERCVIANHSSTSLRYLFSGCSSLQSASISNTSIVSDFSYLFGNCTSLQTVPMLITTAATDMSGMFSNCSSLRSVPLFDTTNTGNMTEMFIGCTSLRSIPLFDTSFTTSMAGMLGYCTTLTSVPFFNTINVTDMSGMFSDCHNLVTVPHFNTTNVTSMMQMFFGCGKLTNIPSFDTSNVTNMSNMFSDCISLLSAPLLDTASVTDMSYIFNYCANLQSIPLLNTANATNISGMFSWCQSLRLIPAIDASMTSSGNFYNIFNGCFSVNRIQMFGINYSIDVQNCKLGAIELNELYGNLATTTGQTITVNGNQGVGSDDPTIATAKGWTVTGS